MARAAVRAKQQAQAKAQPAKKRPRGRRRHAGGGNPNQQLFFVKLRRGQKWLYALLALVFAITFAGVGVGSGSGGGLSQLYTGLFGGGGGTSVSKAQDEIKKHPAQGYRDLANAYETNGDNRQAISALNHYLGLRKNNADAWSELGALELSEGNKYVNLYSTAQQAAQNADPSTPFQPGGSLATQIGTNPAYSSASQAASAQTSAYYQQATGAFSLALKDYQQAAKIHPNDPTALEEVAQAAESGGNLPVALKALQTFVKKFPHSPVLPQIKQQLKQLRKSQPAVSSGHG
ncbi:MAG TPA: tetratricopeptide repeat protein [Gaiellaceae bacterium]|nr:tetratricopeptide repeat protein [Gaiellaceae bacterium]